MRLKIVCIFCLLALPLACDKSPQPPTTPNSNANTAKQPDAHHDGDGHDHGGGHDNANKGGEHAGHGAESIDMGTTTIGEFSIRAARDQGEIKPGGDAPIDIWVMTPDGKPATVSAVRFWVGTESEKGSIKAKAEIEIPTEPNHWHTHGLVPDPLPVDAKLWVEIEKEVGQKVAGSFDLKL